MDDNQVENIDCETDQGPKRQKSSKEEKWLNDQNSRPWEKEG